MGTSFSLRQLAVWMHEPQLRMKAIATLTDTVRGIIVFAIVILDVIFFHAGSFKYFSMSLFIIFICT